MNGVVEAKVNVVVVAVGDKVICEVSFAAVQTGAVAQAVPNVIVPVAAVPPLPTVTRPAASLPAIEGVLPNPEAIVGDVPPANG